MDIDSTADDACKDIGNKVNRSTGLWEVKGPESLNKWNLILKIPNAK